MLAHCMDTSLFLTVSVFFNCEELLRIALLSKGTHQDLESELRRRWLLWPPGLEEPEAGAAPFWAWSSADRMTVVHGRRQEAARM